MARDDEKRFTPDEIVNRLGVGYYEMLIEEYETRISNIRMGYCDSDGERARFPCRDYDQIVILCGAGLEPEVCRNPYFSRYVREITEDTCRGVKDSLARNPFSVYRYICNRSRSGIFPFYQRYVDSCQSVIHSDDGIGITVIQICNRCAVHMIGRRI